MGVGQANKVRLRTCSSKEVVAETCRGGIQVCKGWRKKWLVDSEKLQPRSTVDYLKLDQPAANCPLHG